MENIRESWVEKEDSKSYETKLMTCLNNESVMEVQRNYFSQFFLVTQMKTYTYKITKQRKKMSHLKTMRKMKK